MAFPGCFLSSNSLDSVQTLQSDLQSVWRPGKRQRPHGNPNCTWISRMSISSNQPPKCSEGFYWTVNKPSVPFL